MELPFKYLTLLIPEKVDAERSSVAAAWRSLGGNVITLGRFWEPPPLPYGIRVYGDHVFCHVLAQQLGLTLISPADDLLLRIDHQWIKRALNRTTLDRIRSIPFPCFVKPLVPKLFRARVFDSPFELEEECRQLPSQTGILYGEIVKFTCEARAFTRNGKTSAIAMYEGDGSVEDAEAFIDSFLQENAHLLPAACAVDVGYIYNRGWAIVEFNAAWGAGLNGCDAREAALCIAQASEDRNE